MQPALIFVRVSVSGLRSFAAHGRHLRHGRALWGRPSEGTGLSSSTTTTATTALMICA